jgi:protein involved in polysaccharide export with SLBB domain
MLRSYLRFLLILATLIAPWAVSGCGSPMRTHEIPITAPKSARAPVDPSVELWFRETPLEDAGKFMSGDVLQVSFQGLPEYGVTREIPPDGTLPLFRAPRSLDVRGMTAQQVEAAIREIYADRLDAYVTVTLQTAAPRTVYLAGAVNVQQAASLRPGERLTLLQALTLAGGTSLNADRYAVTIMRYHPELGRVVSSPPLSLASIQDDGDQTDNLVVIPGDTIVVPEDMERQVHILGHVERPGPLRWYRGISLSRAVTESGGFRKFAKTSAIRVVRNGNQTIVFDFTKLLDGEIDELILAPGDVIYVDEKWI